MVGTLHLEQALRSGERRFDPGLLAAAHRGVLYVDEGNAAAIADPVVADNATLADVAAASANGTGQPVNLEMNCAWDAMTNGLVSLYASPDASPADVAAGMQTALENAVAPGGACGPE